MGNERKVDPEKLSSLMSGGWSWAGGCDCDDAELTEEDKDELVEQVFEGLRAEIVDGILVLGKTEVSE